MTNLNFLENYLTATSRGFESHTLRHLEPKSRIFWLLFLCFLVLIFVSCFVKYCFYVARAASESLIFSALVTLLDISRCAYVSAVMVIELCPSHAWIFFISSLLLSMSVAHECLKSWKRICSIPFFLRITLKCSVTYCGFMMSPRGLTQTYSRYSLLYVLSSSAY